MALIELPCDLTHLERYSGCGKCGSDTQLIAALAVILAHLNSGREITISTLMQDAACYKCMSEHQMLVALATCLAEYAVYLGYITDQQQVTEESSCLMCADPANVRAIALHEFCTWLYSLRQGQGV